MEAPAEIKTLSKPTKGKKEIAQIATISAKNDKMMGDLLADAREKVGKDGVVTAEEARGVETALDVVEIISEALSIKLESVKLDDVRKAKKIVVEKENTTIVEGAGAGREIEAGSSRSAPTERMVTEIPEKEKRSRAPRLRPRTTERPEPRGWSNSGPSPP
jgi:chaperonin GroEL (HSP60 family)